MLMHQKFKENLYKEDKNLPIMQLRCINLPIKILELWNISNHLTGGVRATPDWAKGEPGQQGQMITGPNGEQIPQGSSWGGRPEMIHRVGLLTPNNKHYKTVIFKNSCRTEVHLNQLLNKKYDA